MGETPAGDQAPRRQTLDRISGLLRAHQIVVEDLDLGQVLRRIAQEAAELVGAEFGALGVLGPDGTHEQFIHVGMPPEQAARIGHLPHGHGILGAVITSGEPIRLENLGEDPRSTGFPAHHPDMTTFLGVPIRVRGEVFGNLYLSNRRGGPFTAEDEEIVSALAATAAIAIENARLYREAQHLALIEDRARIARDLHDNVIQRLFGAGLALQAIAGRAPEELQERLAAQVDALDAAIGEIRTAVFALGSRSDREQELRNRLLRVVAEVGPGLAISPRITFTGAVDLLVGGGLADDVVAVVRESLANVARHARAGHCEVEVAVADDVVRVRVVDDGIGYRPGRESGIANLAERARLRGGEYRIAAAPQGGTRVDWSGRVDSEEAS